MERKIKVKINDSDNSSEIIKESESANNEVKDDDSPNPTDELTNEAVGEAGGESPADEVGKVDDSGDSGDSGDSEQADDPDDSGKTDEVDKLDDTAQAEQAAQAEQETTKKKPKKILKTVKSESIFRIIFSLIIAVVLLNFPFIIGLWDPNEGFVPIFSVLTLNALWFLIVIWTIAAIVREVFKIVIGRYNYRLALIVAITNAVIFLCICIVFFHSEIINPRFIPWLNEVSAGGIPEFIQIIFGNMNLIVLGAVTFGLISEVISSYARARKYSR